MARTVDALRRAEAEQLTRVVRELPAYPAEITSPAWVAEEYARMKQKILGFNSGHPEKSLVFCSAGRGEGTSTVLTGFARVLGAAGERVLLVDANLRYPSLHRLFGLQQEQGFSDLAREGTRPDEVIKRTGLKNVAVVTSGAVPAPRCLVLESPHLPGQLAQLKARADWLLFDTPPVTSCHDAVLLSGRAGGVVMVLHAEKTRWEVAQETLQNLQNSGAKIFGVFLNRRRYPIPAWLYKRI